MVFWGVWFLFWLSFADAIIDFADLCAWHSPFQDSSCQSQAPRFLGFVFVLQRQILCADNSQYVYLA